LWRLSQDCFPIVFISSATALPTKCSHGVLHHKNPYLKIDKRLSLPLTCEIVRRTQRIIGKWNNCGHMHVIHTTFVPTASPYWCQP
jgi:hypothetical protein